MKALCKIKSEVIFEMKLYTIFWLMILNLPVFTYFLKYMKLHLVPDTPIISNRGYYTENIFAFLDFHIKPSAKSVKSYIKDTNDSLNKSFKNCPKMRFFVPLMYLACTQKPS